ncbi:MAG: hypothetical protein K2R93_16000 [Gemmatimonadaceae bacterium]|nr:hypothetical protein [Gemmatimonadaceae bacterium]
MATLVLELTRSRGVAVHPSEVEEELRRRYPDESPFDVALVVAQLCTSGVLLYVYGRPPHGRYAHREHPVDAVPPGEPMAAAVAVVERHWTETGTEAPTSLITEGMRALGVQLPDPRNYRLILDALTRPSTRGAPAWRAPRLAARAVTTLDGRRRTLWRPAAAPAPDQRMPVSQAEGVMEAVRRTEAALGRPVSRVETALWVATHATSAPAAAFVRTTGCLGRGLEQLSTQRTSRLVQGRGTWRVLRNPHTVPGGAPERYTLGEVSNVMHEAMALEDRLRLLRPSAELETLVVARSIAMRLGLPELHQLIATREVLLSALLRPVAQSDVLEEAIGLLQRSNAVLMQWAGQAHVNARSGKLAPMAELNRELSALRTISVAAPGERPSVRIVGEAAVVSHRQLHPYAAAVPRLLGRAYAGEESLRMFYSRARRVPNPDARWAQNRQNGSLIPAEREGLGWLLVDRVDAMAGIMDAVSPPRAISLLHGARVLLGHVLRDAPLIRACLSAIPLARSDGRRPLILALALLGEEVSYEEAVPDPADEMDTAAYLLSLVLCQADRARLTGTVLRVIQGAKSAEARRTATEAARLIGGGLLPAAVG